MSAIEEIKQKIDIVDIVSEFVPLQKTGKYYRALCPFHTERHPSFYVFPERQIWYCFGACQTGGDVFSFIMKKENLPFGEALRLLAQRAGITLAPHKKEKEEVKKLHQINQISAQFYHHFLIYSPKAEFPRQYLKQRGISLESILQFQLGYSPFEGKALKQYLLEQGFGEDDLLRAGLIIKRDGESFDLFRHRLLFPIKDIQGRVVGFGGRALDDSLPKYLNSPQTEVFDKGSLLYGLDRAKNAIRKQDKVVLVEGYIDVIIAHQYNFDYVVGTMGTSLTERQFLNLKGLTKNIILSLDADMAGLQAILQGMEIIGKVMHKVRPILTARGKIKYEPVLDAEIKVLVLPEGKDPDEIIKQDPQNWQKMVEKAVPAMDYVLSTLTSQTNLAQASEKSNLVRRLKPYFDEIKDPIKWGHYVQKLSRLIGVEEQILASALRPPIVKEEGREEKVEIPIPSTYPLEEYCLALLLQNPELKEESVGILPHYFQQSQNRELFLSWQKAGDISSLKEGLEPCLKEYMESLMNRSLPPLSPEDKKRALSHCLLRLKQEFLRLRLKAEELSQSDELEKELRQTFIKR